jgi:hypothetical protein
MRVSKNIEKGKQIRDITELFSLSLKKKSVVVQLGEAYFVRPAAFLMEWRLSQLLKAKLFYAHKESDNVQNETNCHQ